MSIDDIKKWTELKASDLEIVYDPLDDFLRMGQALRTTVEALDKYLGKYVLSVSDGSTLVPIGKPAQEALASIRETLGIKTNDANVVRSLNKRITELEAELQRIRTTWEPPKDAP